MPFCYHRNDYLGHIILGTGVKANPTKLQSMLDWPTLKSVKILRGFLGLLGYYRKFIRGYELLATPLTYFLKNAFHWSNDVERAFNTLKTENSYVVTTGNSYVVMNYWLPHSQIF